MKKTDKPNPLKFFNDNKAMAYKKAGGEMAAFKNSLKRMNNGGETGTEEGSPKSSSETTTTSSPAPAPAPNFATMTNKEYKQYKKGVKREKKIENIKSGKQTERVDNIIKAVGSGAEAISNVAGAVQKGKQIFGNNNNGPQRKGGIIKSRQIAKRGGSVGRKK
jgi:hypothetical protein